MSNKFFSQFLFIDIETGGLTAFDQPGKPGSSVLSFTSALGSNKPTTFRTDPVVGSAVSTFTQKTVIPRLSGTKVASEQVLLEKIAETIERGKGKTLIGWNSGLNTLSQSVQQRGGLDIPYILERSKKYGMEERFRTAISGVKVRDIGQEFALSIAGQVSQYGQGIVEKNIRKQAYGYVKKYMGYRRQGMPEKEALSELGVSGTRFAGWKQEDVYSLLFGRSYQAHSSQSDIEALQKIVKTVPQPLRQLPKEFSGPSFVSRWQRTTLPRLLSTQNAPVSELRQRAKQFGVLPEFEKFYSERVPEGFTIFGQVAKAPSTSWKKWAIAGGAAIVGAGLAYGVYNSFTARDDEYNTIEGLRHGGEAQRMRRLLTDFGSGYQGQENSSEILEKRDSNILFKTLLGGGIGAGIAIGIDRYLYQNIPITNEDLLKYPNLQELRTLSAKGGFHVLNGNAPIEEIESTLKNKKGLFWNFNVGPRVREKFDLLKGNLPEHIVGYGKWSLGADKYKTFQYFKRRGRQGDQPLTFAAKKILNLKKFNETKDIVFALNSKKTRRKLAKYGGPGNLILKQRHAALQKGVWIGLSNVPEVTWKDVFENPDKYLFQVKEDLAQEFRAITVGGKSVYQVHRFGSLKAKQIVENLATKYPKVVSSIKEKHLIENIIPIADENLSRRLTEFVERQHSLLPKEVPITAWDIGLTKSGEFKIIEMQRIFGTYRMPWVQESIERSITGKMGKWGKRSFGLGIGLGIATVGLSNLFSGKDDEYNTIEGLRHGGMAEKKRKEMTDFGSGFTRRTWNVFKTFWNESNREISHIVKEMIIPGVKKGQPLELGVTALTGYELAHAAMTTLAGSLTFTGAIGTLASLSVSKFVYAGIKQRKKIAQIAKLAKTHPEEAKLLTKYASQKSMKEIYNYWVKGQQNYFSTFAHFGGGEIGRQAVSNRAAVEFVNSGFQFSGKDDVYNIIEGLRHGGMAEQLRKVLSDFGSGWIRKAISKGINPLTIASNLSRSGRVARMSEEAFMGGVKEIMSSSPLEKLGSFLNKSYGAKVSNQQHESLIKFIESATEIRGTAGERWVMTRKLGEGGFGAAFSVFGVRSNRLAVAKFETQSLDLSAGNMPMSAMLANAMKRNDSILFTNRVYEMSKNVSTKLLADTGKFGSKLSLLHEAEMTKLARSTLGNMVPEIYESSADYLVQEHAGKTLASLGDKAKLIGYKKAFSVYKNMSLAGEIMHYDPSARNILVKAGKIRIIDFGFASSKTDHLANTPLLEAFQDEIEILSIRQRTKIPSHPVISNSMIDDKQAMNIIDQTKKIEKTKVYEDLHNKANIDRVNYSTQPGKRHTSYATRKI